MIFERFISNISVPLIFGASNASRDQVTIWDKLNQYNQANPNDTIDLRHLAHSLGASSTKNAMNWADYKGMTFDYTTLDANTVGTSYPITNSTLGARLTAGLYDQGYTEKASQLFKDGSVTYAVAPRDIVGTGIGLPWVPGSWSLGIGNTNTTGSNTIGIPLWGILSGDHTVAYYKDESIMRFSNTIDGKIDESIVNKIKDYQYKTWKQVGPKTEKTYFENKSILKGE